MALRSPVVKALTESARLWAESSRKWRWPTAFALGLGAVVAAVVAVYTDAAAVCKDAVAGPRTVRVCSPPSVGQLAFLFIPALLLLLSDLSEVDVVGFGFKRDLDETKDKVDETQGTVTEQVEELGQAVARLEERSADVQTARVLAENLDRLARALRDIELTSARDTDVLRGTLETLADIDERLGRCAISA
jgi:methyl-accepting chemotaxis protein